MIVWGGEDAATNTEIKTGGRYNPSTDSWVADGDHDKRLLGASIIRQSGLALK